MVELQEDLFPELDRCLSLYLADYRALLLREEIAHAFVFVNAKGEAFKSSAFSEYLGRLLTRLTGRKATSNILRSSFVTNLMETNPSDSEKTSAQSLLRHSERKQAEVYDRRGERFVFWSVDLTSVCWQLLRRRRLRRSGCLPLRQQRDCEKATVMLRLKHRKLGSSRRRLRWAETCSWSFRSSIQVVWRRFASDGHSNLSFRNWCCVILVCQNSSCDRG